VGGSHEGDGRGGAGAESRAVRYTILWTRVVCSYRLLCEGCVHQKKDQKLTKAYWMLGAGLRLLG
jgi:hypothetical protein